MRNANRYLLPLLAVLIYTLLVVWLTWPAMDNLGTAILGDEGDAFVHLWTYDWVKDALTSGQSPYYTNRLFFPQGVELYTHNIAWLNIAIWLPLQALIGGNAAYTVVYLIILVLNGLATYFLVDHLTNNRAAAFLSGLIVTGWSPIIASFSQPNLIFIAFVPLALLAMHRLLLSRKWLDVLWLGLAVAGIGLSRYQMLIMSVPILVLAALYWLWETAAAYRKQSFLQLVAAAGLALAFLLPFVWPVVQFQITREFAEDIVVLRNEAELTETDLLGYFLPSEGTPLVGSLIDRFFPDLLTHTPIGIVTLGLVIMGLFASRRDKWLWLCIALLLLVLALGRVLTINGIPLFSLPYAWLEDNLFLIQLIRYPFRFSMLLSIPIAVLAGYGVLLISSSVTPKVSWVIVAILAGLISLGYRVPDYPLLNLEVPIWYEQLAEEEDEFGLVTIPLTRIFDERAMSYQLTHGKPLVGGHVSRLPREASTLMEQTPFLAWLRERTLEPPDIDDISGQLRPLSNNNLPYVVIHKHFLTLDQVSQWRRWMGIAPFYEDNDLLVYPTSLIAGEDFRVQETAVSGLSFVEGQLTPNRITQGEVLTGIVHWLLKPTTTRAWNACYEITDVEGNLVEAVCEPLSFPPATNGEDQLIRKNFELTLTQELDIGTYQANVQLQSEDGQESEKFELGSLYVSGKGRQFNPPQPETSLAVDLGSSLTLVGYDGPWVGNQSLDLTLFWHAREEMDYYKFYVHVLDAQSGELVTQLDYVPLDWSYPTNMWQAGEYISDQISLSLSGVVPGVYRVEIGVYQPDTGERLVAQDLQGTLFTNNSISLGTVEISDPIN